jgi:uncharacterized spore protein YtfJ
MPEESLVERLAHLINAHANAKQVFADPIERDGTTIIPVAKVQWGFGGGGLGQGLHERGGGGGGVRATPAGFIQIREGQAEFRHYRDASDFAVIAGVAVAGFVLGLFLGSVRRG